MSHARALQLEHRETTRKNVRAAAPRWIALGPSLARRLLTAAVTSLAAAAVGCAAQGDDAASADEAEIFGGVRDDDARAQPGVVALRIGAESGYELCSGAVIAPNVVLTALHCVARTTADRVSCNEAGESTNGAHFAELASSAEVAVFVGATPSFSSEPSARVTSIVAPDTNAFCNSDLALVVLDRPLEGIAPLAVRMGAPARRGETIRAVGYGKSEASPRMGTRYRRERVPVLAIGSGVTTSKTRLGEREFEVGRSICQGDSGGPAISELTGAVIGVVSRGGACDDDFGHVYTTTAGFDALFEEAFARADASPLVEANTPPPAPEVEETTTRAHEPEAQADAGAEGGCAVARGSRGSLQGALAAIVFGLLLTRRRGRAAASRR